MAPLAAHERPPRIAFGVRSSILRRSLFYVARTAECLQVVRVPRIAAAVQWDPVIAFEPAGPLASHAPPAVALENPEPEQRPSVARNVGVVTTHVFSVRCIMVLSNSRQ